MSSGPAGIVVRRVFRVRGTVQGVGFRPFVYHEAVSRGLTGAVRNGPDGVRIELEGDLAALDAFAGALRDSAPPLARLDAVDVSEEPARGTTSFAIEASEVLGPRTAWPPVDVAPCAACRRELADPSDRRFGYPFIVCTDCGPRFTLVRALPYDRSRTSMARFRLCEACRAEYEDPTTRRFHAEPNACAACGPTLRFETERASTDASAAPLARCVDALRSGAIVAVKGVGGFHLACDAGDPAAVERLRARKRREAKPLAVMCADLAGAERWAELSEAERAALSGPARPIVLLRKRAGADLAPGIAPGLREIGLMLPSSPLHQLLADAFGGPLVMTSGNLAEEPIAREDQEARARLRDVADAFLLHDREILARLDDSIVRVEGGAMRVLRRSRGMVPDPIPLAARGRILAAGADLKGTLCAVIGGMAFVGQHLGDLASPEARAAWLESLATFRSVLELEPDVVACDLHPDHATTRLAEALGRPLVRVQHHHAHVAACMAEHGRDRTVVGVVLDGAGHGEDGAVWGCEILVADREKSERAAHLRYVRLPGGDAAAREPWRMALAHLEDAGEPTAGVAPRGREAEAEVLARAMRRGVASPWTSSAGRLFDAVAAIAGVRSVGQFEAQAAMELEALSAAGEPRAYPFVIEGRAPAQIDLRPAIREIARDARAGVAAAEIGARFHATLADALLAVAVPLARERGIDAVVLSGGCFQNARLAAACTAGIQGAGLRVLRPARYPCNDGGISLGQAAVAAARIGGG